MSRSAHAPAPRSTCPWGPENAQVPVAPVRAVPAQSTCPWGLDSDGHGKDKALQAARRIQGTAPPPYGISAAPTAPVAQMEAEVTGPLRADGPALPAAAQSEEEKEAEKRALIEQCFERGMSEEEIYEVLDEFNNQKFLEELERKGSVGAPPPERTAPLREVNGQDVDDNVSLASKRAKAKATSEASVAAYDAGKARNAYDASQRSAQAARDRNRSGSGIF
eukprot:TRINITY_DN79990_c0_g1_i1.p1 TRINITY_DN79990_c0_g1~~TRINITY_DN79990_c0_g1_i1.p1  ORF type:complete len:221 (+),score=66.81 TRINITY_DN79990_c0_g1_i1:85-747(+)